MRHPLVDLAYKKYLTRLPDDQPLITGKASSHAEKTFREEADKFVRDIEHYPHAFVLACLMDTGVDANIAWTIPFKMFKTLGTFAIQELYQLSEQDYISMFNCEKKWHRYPSIKAKVFYETVHKIVDNKFLAGDASKIWLGKPSSHDVVLRFMDFKGCGFKIANMAANILCRYFGVEYSDYSSIDIAPDVHTVRVFQRLGLTPYGVETEIARIYTIVKARELNPEFPGIVSNLCWKVGREYCHPHNPKCTTCPFAEFCKKELKSEVDIWTRRD